MPLLEGWLAGLLQRVLGAYVRADCFDAKRVQLDVWTGYVVLTRLELRPDALDFLGLPVALRRGSIARVELHIPWGSAARAQEATVVKVDEVFLLLETLYEWDSQREEARAASAVRAKLETVVRAQARARRRAERREAARAARAAHGARNARADVRANAGADAGEGSGGAESESSAVRSGADAAAFFSADAGAVYGSAATVAGAGAAGTALPSTRRPGRRRKRGSARHDRQPPPDEGLPRTSGPSIAVAADGDDWAEREESARQRRGALGSEDVNEGVRDESGSGSDSGSEAGLLTDLEDLNETASIAASLYGADDGGSENGGGDEIERMPGFFSKLLAQVVNNLEIHVRGVHIRWEDRVSSPQRPFAFGLCAEMLNVYNSVQPEGRDRSGTGAERMLPSPRTGGASFARSTASKPAAVAPMSFVGAALSVISGGGGSRGGESRRGESVRAGERGGRGVVADPLSATPVHSAPNVGQQDSKSPVRKSIDISMLSAYFHTREASTSIRGFVPGFIGDVDLFSCDAAAFERAMGDAIPTRKRAQVHETSSRSASDERPFAAALPKLLADSGPEARGDQLLPRLHPFRSAFVLLPVNADCTLVLSRSAHDLRMPQRAVDASVSTLALRVQRAQYHDCLALVAGFDSFARRRRFVRVRPAQRLIVWPPRPLSRPQFGRNAAAASASVEVDPTRRRIALAWWRYAVFTCISDIQKQGAFVWWRTVADRRVVRRAYVWLYKRKLCGYHAPRQWSGMRVRALQQLHARRAFVDEDEEDLDDAAEGVEARVSVEPAKREGGGSAEWLHKNSEAALLRNVLDERIFRQPWREWAAAFRGGVVEDLRTAEEAAQRQIEAQQALGLLEESRRNFALEGASASSMDLVEAQNNYEAAEKRFREAEVLAASTLDTVRVLLRAPAPRIRQSPGYTRLNAHEHSLLALLEERLGADDLLLFRLLAEQQIEEEGGVAHMILLAKSHRGHSESGAPDSGRRVSDASDDNFSLASSGRSYLSSLADLAPASAHGHPSTRSSGASSGSESGESSDGLLDATDPIPGRRRGAKSQGQQRGVAIGTDAMSNRSEDSRSVSTDSQGSASVDAPDFDQPMPTLDRNGNSGGGSSTLRWLGLEWMWPNRTASVVAETAGADTSAPQTQARAAADAQRREIYAAIGYDPKDVLQPFPTSYVVTEVTVRLATASATMLECIGPTLPRARPLIQCRIDALELQFRQRPTSHHARLTLDDASIRHCRADESGAQDALPQPGGGTPIAAPFLMLFCDPARSKGSHAEGGDVVALTDTDSLACAPPSDASAFAAGPAASTRDDHWPDPRTWVGQRSRESEPKSLPLLAEGSQRASKSSGSGTESPISRNRASGPLLLISFETFPEELETDDEADDDRAQRSPVDVGAGGALSADAHDDDSSVSSGTASSPRGAAPRIERVGKRGNVIGAGAVAKRALGLQRNATMSSSSVSGASANSSSVRSRFGSKTRGSQNRLQSADTDVRSAVLSRIRGGERERQQKQHRKPRWTAGARLAVLVRLRPVEVVFSSTAVAAVSQFLAAPILPLLETRSGAQRENARTSTVGWSGRRDPVAYDVEIASLALLVPENEFEPRSIVFVLECGEARLASIKLHSRHTIAVTEAAMVAASLAADGGSTSAPAATNPSTEANSPLARASASMRCAGLFDSYSIALPRVQVALVRADTPWRAPGALEARGLRVLPSCSASLTVHVGVLPPIADGVALRDDQAFSSLRFDLQVPTINLRVSGAQMSALQRVANGLAASPGNLFESARGPNNGVPDLVGNPRGGLDSGRGYDHSARVAVFSSRALDAFPASHSRTGSIGVSSTRSVSAAPAAGFRSPSRDRRPSSGPDVFISTQTFVSPRRHFDLGRAALGSPAPVQIANLAATRGDTTKGVVKDPASDNARVLFVLGQFCLEIAHCSRDDLELRFSPAWTPLPTQWPSREPPSPQRARHPPNLLRATSLRATSSSGNVAAQPAVRFSQQFRPAPFGDTVLAAVVIEELRLSSVFCRSGPPNLLEATGGESRSTATISPPITGVADFSVGSIALFDCVQPHGDAFGTIISVARSPAARRSQQNALNISASRRLKLVPLISADTGPFRLSGGVAEWAERTATTSAQNACLEDTAEICLGRVSVILNQETLVRIAQEFSAEASATPVLAPPDASPLSSTDPSFRETGPIHVGSDVKLDLYFHRFSTKSELIGKIKLESLHVAFVDEGRDIAALQFIDCAVDARHSILGEIKVMKGREDDSSFLISRPQASSRLSGLVRSVRFDDFLTCFTGRPRSQTDSSAAARMSRAALSAKNVFGPRQPSGGRPRTCAPVPALFTFEMASLPTAELAAGDAAAPFIPSGSVAALRSIRGISELDSAESRDNFERIARANFCRVTAGAAHLVLDSAFASPFAAFVAASPLLRYLALYAKSERSDSSGALAQLPRIDTSAADCGDSSAEMSPAVLLSMFRLGPAARRFEVVIDSPALVLPRSWATLPNRASPAPENAVDSPTRHRSLSVPHGDSSPVSSDRGATATFFHGDEGIDDDDAFGGCDPLEPDITHDRAEESRGGVRASLPSPPLRPRASPQSRVNALAPHANLISVSGIADFIAVDLGSISVSNAYALSAISLWREKIALTARQLHAQVTSRLGVAGGFSAKMVRDVSVDALFSCPCSFSRDAAGPAEFDVSIGDVNVECADAFFPLVKAVWVDNAAMLFSLLEQCVGVGNQNGGANATAKMRIGRATVSVKGFWVFLSRSTLLAESIRADSGPASASLALFDVARLHISSSTLVFTDDGQSWSASMAVSALTVSDTRKDRKSLRLHVVAPRTAPGRQQLSSQAPSTGDRGAGSHGLRSAEPAFLLLSLSSSPQPTASRYDVDICLTLEPLRIVVVPELLEALKLVTASTLRALSFVQRDPFRLSTAAHSWVTNRNAALSTAAPGAPEEYPHQARVPRARHFALSALRARFSRPEVWLFLDDSDRLSEAVVLRVERVTAELDCRSDLSTSTYGRFVESAVLAAATEILVMRKPSEPAARLSSTPLRVRVVESASQRGNEAAPLFVQRVAADFNGLAVLLHRPVDRTQQGHTRPPAHAISPLAQPRASSSPVSVSTYRDGALVPPFLRPSASAVWGAGWAAGNLDSAGAISLPPRNSSGLLPLTESAMLSTSPLAHASEAFQGHASWDAPLHPKSSDLQAPYALAQFFSGDGAAQIRSGDGVAIGLTRRLVLPFSVSVSVEARSLAAVGLEFDAAGILVKRAARFGPVWATQKSAAAAMLDGVLSAARSITNSIIGSGSFQRFSSPRLQAAMLPRPQSGYFVGSRGPAALDLQQSGSPHANPAPDALTDSETSSSVIAVADDDVLRDVLLYNREAARQNATALADALASVSDESLGICAVGSEEGRPPQRPSPLSAQRPILARQVTEYRAAHIVVGQSVTVCLSPADLRLLEAALQISERVRLSLFSGSGGDEGDGGSTLSADHMDRGPAQTDISAVLRPSPQCYALRGDLPSMHLVLVNRDSGPTLATPRHDDSLCHATPRGIADFGDARSCFTVPLARCDVSGVEVLLSGAPVLGTLRVRAQIGVDHSNALLARWEPVVDPWPFDALVAVLRSALSNEGSEGRDGAHLGKPRNVVGTDVREVWFPQSLLHQASLDGLSLLRRQQRGEAWSAGVSLGGSGSGARRQRWYDFGSMLREGHDADAGHDDSDGTFFGQRDGEDGGSAGQWLSPFSGRDTSSATSERNSGKVQRIVNQTGPGIEADRGGRDGIARHVHRPRALQPVEVTVSSQSSLRLNVSTASCATLALASRLFSESAQSIKPVALYTGRNDTGCDLSYWASSGPFATSVDPKSARQLPRSLCAPLRPQQLQTEPGRSSSASGEQSDAAEPEPSFDQLGGELLVWPREHSSLGSTTTNLQGLSVCLALSFPPPPSTPLPSFDSETLRSDGPDLSSAASGTIGSESPDRFNLPSLRRLPSQVTSWQVLGHNSQPESLPADHATARVVLFPAPLNSGLPQTPAVFECGVGCGDRGAPLSRSIRIRSTLAVANFLATDVRIEAIVRAPRAPDLQISSIADSSASCGTPRIVWSETLAPFCACWVPAPLALWSMPRDDLAASVSFRLVAHLPGQFCVTTLDIDPSQLNQPSIAAHSGSSPLSRSWLVPEASPQICASAAWGAIAHRRMRACTLVDSASSCDKGNADSADANVTCGQDEAGANRFTLAAARAASTEHFECVCTAQNAVLPSPSSVAAVSCTNGSCEMWPPCPAVANKIERNSRVRGSPRHGYLACLSFHAPVSLQNRLLEPCDILVTRRHIESAQRESDQAITWSDLKDVGPITSGGAGQGSHFCDDDGDPTALAASVRKPPRPPRTELPFRSSEHQAGVAGAPCQEPDTHVDSMRARAERKRSQEWTLEHRTFHLAPGASLQFLFGEADCDEASRRRSSGASQPAPDDSQKPRAVASVATFGSESEPFIVRVRPSGMYGWSSGFLLPPSPICFGAGAPGSQTPVAIPLGATQAMPSCNPGGPGNSDSRPPTFSGGRHNLHSSCLWLRVFDRSNLASRTGAVVSVGLHGGLRVALFSAVSIVNRSALPLHFRAEMHDAAEDSGASLSASCDQGERESGGSARGTSAPLAGLAHSLSSLFAATSSVPLAGQEAVLAESLGHPPSAAASLPGSNELALSAASSMTASVSLGPPPTSLAAGSGDSSLPDGDAQALLDWATGATASRFNRRAAQAPQETHSWSVQIRAPGTLPSQFFGIARTASADAYSPIGGTPALTINRAVSNGFGDSDLVLTLPSAQDLSPHPLLAQLPPPPYTLRVSASNSGDESRPVACGCEWCGGSDADADLLPLVLPWEISSRLQRRQRHGLAKPSRFPHTFTLTISPAFVIHNATRRPIFVRSFPRFPGPASDMLGSQDAGYDSQGQPPNAAVLRLAPGQRSSLHPQHSGVLRTSASVEFANRSASPQVDAAAGLLRAATATYFGPSGTECSVRFASQEESGEPTRWSGRISVLHDAPAEMRNSLARGASEGMRVASVAGAEVGVALVRLPSGSQEADSFPATQARVLRILASQVRNWDPLSRSESLQRRLRAEIGAESLDDVGVSIESAATVGIGASLLTITEGSTEPEPVLLQQVERVPRAATDFALGCEPFVLLNRTTKALAVSQSSAPVFSPCRGPSGRLRVDAPMRADSAPEAFPPGAVMPFAWYEPAVQGLPRLELFAMIGGGPDQGAVSLGHFDILAPGISVIKRGCRGSHGEQRLPVPDADLVLQVLVIPLSGRVVRVVCVQPAGSFVGIPFRRGSWGSIRIPAVVPLLSASASVPTPADAFLSRLVGQCGETPEAPSSPIEAILGRHARVRVRLARLVINLVESTPDGLHSSTSADSFSAPPPSGRAGLGEEGAYSAQEFPLCNVGGAHILSVTFDGVSLLATDKGSVRTAPNEAAVGLRISRCFRVAVAGIVAHRSSPDSPHIYKAVLRSASPEGAGGDNASEKRAAFSAMEVLVSESPFVIRMPDAASSVAVDPFEWRNLGYAATHVRVAAAVQVAGTSDSAIALQVRSRRRPPIIVSLDADTIAALLQFAASSNVLAERCRSGGSTAASARLCNGPAAGSGIIARHSCTHTNVFVDAAIGAALPRPGRACKSLLATGPHQRQCVSGLLLRSGGLRYGALPPVLLMPSRLALGGAGPAGVAASRQSWKISVPAAVLHDPSSGASALHISSLTLERSFAVLASWQAQGSAAGAGTQGADDAALGAVSGPARRILAFLRRLPNIASQEKPLRLSVPSFRVADVVVGVSASPSFAAALVRAALPRALALQLLRAWELPAVLRTLAMIYFSAE